MGMTLAEWTAYQDNRTRAGGAAQVVSLARCAVGPVTVTVFGPPRTKKNSNIHATDSDGRTFPLPSKAWQAWLATCRIDPYPPPRLVDAPYNACALFYRDVARGDAVGFYQGLADLLQESHGGRGVLSDDKWIVSWDGSRLCKDADNPRVEVTLTPQFGPSR